MIYLFLGAFVLVIMFLKWIVGRPVTTGDLLLGAAIVIVAFSLIESCSK
jgi:hypothetical protein